MMSCTACCHIENRFLQYVCKLYYILVAVVLSLLVMILPRVGGDSTISGDISISGGTFIGGDIAICCDTAISGDDINTSWW